MYVYIHMCVYVHIYGVGLFLRVTPVSHGSAGEAGLVFGGGASCHTGRLGRAFEKRTALGPYSRPMPRVLGGS